MADQSDPKPWTIKNLPWEERNAAIAAAERDKMDIGPWMARAIRQTIQADLKADRAPVALEQPGVRPSAPGVDLAQLDHMMAIAEKVHAMSGKPLPQDIRGKAHRLLRVGLKAMEVGPMEPAERSAR